MPTHRSEPGRPVSWAQVAALRLDRQHLIERLPASRLLDVVREFVGIQAQVMSLAELQLNARVDGLRPSDVRDALWEQRSLVKTWAMRGTLHLIASDDLPSFLAAAPTRGQWGGPAWLKYFGVNAEQLAALFAAIPRALGAEPLTRAELARAAAAAAGMPKLEAKLSSGWGSFLKPSSHAGDLVFGPDRGRNVTFVDPSDWLGRPIREEAAAVAPSPDVALGKLVARFLRLFPGADAAGVGRWWGGRYTTKKAVKAANLALTDVDIEGVPGWALAADADALATSTPFQGVRLLPGFDAYVNDLPRRTDALMPVDRHDEVHRVAGWVSPVVIVDGRVMGTWGLTNGKRGGISVRPFGRWRGGARQELAAEADRVAAFLDRPLKLEYGSGT
jgi:hypothetical protein